MSPLIQLVCFCSSHTKPAHTILMLPWTTCCTTPYIVLWWDLQCTCIDMWIHGFHPIACHDRQYIDWEVSERLLTSGGAEGYQLLSNEICGMIRLQYVTRGKTTICDERKDHKQIRIIENCQNGLNPSLPRCKNPRKWFYIQNLPNISMRVVPTSTMTVLWGGISWHTEDLW